MSTYEREIPTTASINERIKATNSRFSPPAGQKPYIMQPHSYFGITPYEYLKKPKALPATTQTNLNNQLAALGRADTARVAARSAAAPAVTAGAAADLAAKQARIGVGSGKRGGGNFVDNLSDRGATDPNNAVDLGTVTNDYASGGDGTVAREAAPTARSVSVGMGLPREELVRRMENASTSMRGSPTARAAMMGMYADGLKAYDQVGIDNNQGNIRHDGLAFQQNMEANMQSARGKQEFGNAMGLMRYKGQQEMDLAKANADPEKRALELDKLRAETANLGSKGAMDAAKYDATAQETADKAINARAAQIAGGSTDPAVVAAAADQAARERITLMGDTDSAAGKAVLSKDGRGISEALGAWKRIGGFWTDNNTRPMPAGAVVDPSNVTSDYGTADDDNNFNDWFGGIPWVEKDRRIVYTNPETKEQSTQWLDPGEKADKSVLDAVDAYNTPAYRQKAAERRRLGQPKN